MFSGQINLFREVLEPGIRFCNVKFEFQHAFIFSFFFSRSVKSLSRLSASAVSVLIPEYWFIQSGVNCRQILHLKMVGLDITQLDCVFHYLLYFKFVFFF